MQTPCYDIMIIGGGPAGANFARRIDSEKYRVCLIDGSDEAHPKPCGGLISPDAQAVLAKYHISLPKDLLVSPQLFSVRTIDLENGLTKYYKRNYLNVDRHEFDRFLLKMVPPTVSVIKAKCIDIAYLNGEFHITLKEGGSLFTVSCKQLVGADGASSLVRKNFFKNKPAQKYIAIQQWFPAQNMNPYYSCLFDSSTSESCSWIFFKDHWFIFGGAFRKKGCREAFEKQKLKLLALGLASEEALSLPAKTEACEVLRPHAAYGMCRGSKGCYLIGEAAGFISPSSLEGISYALFSSEALAQAINRSASPKKAFKKYKRKTVPLTLKIRLKCLKRPFMYHKILRGLVMKSGIATIKPYEAAR